MTAIGSTLLMASTTCWSSSVSNTRTCSSPQRANSAVIWLPASIGISPTATRGTTYSTTPVRPRARLRAAALGR